MELPSAKCQPVEYSHSPIKLATTSPKLAATESKLKTRRGYGRKNRKLFGKIRPFTVIGTNTGGINSKKESLFHLINSMQPSIIMLQETKCTHYRTIKIPGYETFENLRNVKKGGGGLLTAAHVDLNPFIVTDNEEVELLVIQVEVDNIKIRVVNGYGPQEDDESLKIITFWRTLEAEIICAKDEGCLLIVELDANAKIGKEHLKNDPNPMSKNGKILIDLVRKNGLHIVNSSAKCKGVITRERILENRIERSVIDYFIVCDDIIDYLDEMVVDDERNFVLRHVTKRKGAKDYIKSDHNILISKFSLKIQHKKSQVRREFFNFKSEEARKLFFEDTNTTTDLSSCFSKDKNFEVSCKSFFKELNKKFHKNFTKVRIKKGGNMRCGNYDLQIRLKIKRDIEILIKNTKCSVSLQLLRNQLGKIENQIADIQARSNTEVIRKYLDACNTDQGKFSQNGFWKLKSPRMRY